MVLKMKILKICMLSHLYKLLGNPCQVIIKAMLPCAECQNVTLFVVSFLRIRTEKFKYF
jgi:hypothetical protein